MPICFYFLRLGEEHKYLVFGRRTEGVLAGCAGGMLGSEDTRSVRRGSPGRGEPSVASINCVSDQAGGDGHRG